MKRILMILTATLLVLVAATANAETYKVKKGDCLSKIAACHHIKWQVLYQANKTIISNPDLIYPGQLFQIPEKGSKGSGRVTALSNKSKPFFWKHPAANPFGKRDFIKAINKLNLPSEVKTRLIAKVKNAEFEWHQIKSGNHFEQMIFGNYRVVNNVCARWKPSRLLAAKKYSDSVRYENRVYYLVDPLICHNWAWWSEIEEAVKPPAEIAPEVVAAPPPEIVPPPPQTPVETEQLKPIVLMMVPLPVEEVEEKVEFKVPPQPKEVRGLCCQMDFEAWTYAGHNWGVQSGNNKDWGNYYGGNISFFPCELQSDGAIFRAGPSFQWVGWDGQVGDILGYQGQMTLYGAEAQYITGSTKDQLKVYYGKKIGEVDGIGDFLYNSGEWNRMLAIEPSHQWWYNRKWFSEFEIGARAEIDLGGDKHSSWAGEAIPQENDQRLKQGAYSLRGKTEFYRSDSAVWTFQVSGGYREFDQTLVLEPRIGVKFWEVVEPAISYDWRENSQNDSVGAHIVLNLSELVKRVWVIMKKEVVK